MFNHGNTLIVVWYTSDQIHSNLNDTNQSCKFIYKRGSLIVNTQMNMLLQCSLSILLIHMSFPLIYVSVTLIHMSVAPIYMSVTLDSHFGHGITCHPSYSCVGQSVSPSDSHVGRSDSHVGPSDLCVSHSNSHVGHSESHVTLGHGRTYFELNNYGQTCHRFMKDNSKTAEAE